MDKKYWEQKEIAVYWWNMGKKTLDYKGTYKGFLQAKDIKVSRIVSNGVKGFRFVIPLFSSKATLNTFDSDYARCCNDAIRVFLTLMGDRAKLETPNRDFNIN